MKQLQTQIYHKEVQNESITTNHEEVDLSGTRCKMIINSHTESHIKAKTRGGPTCAKVAVGS